MQLLSVNVGQPQEVSWNNKTVRTSIFKYPIQGSANVSFSNVEGDAQADLRFHGGEHKAVYSYAQEAYDLWQEAGILPQWEFGMFGENLTTQGLLETEVKLGAVYQIGSTRLQVTQPRIPCSKLNVRFQRKDMTALFFDFKQYGIYFKVIQEGRIQAGDSIQLVEASPYAISVRDAVECFVNKGSDRQLLKAILDIPTLPQGIRDIYLKF